MKQKLIEPNMNKSLKQAKQKRGEISKEKQRQNYTRKLKKKKHLLSVKEKQTRQKMKKDNILGKQSKVLRRPETNHDKKTRTIENHK